MSDETIACARRLLETIFYWTRNCESKRWAYTWSVLGLKGILGSAGVELSWFRCGYDACVAGLRFELVSLLLI